MKERSQAFTQKINKLAISRSKRGAGFVVHLEENAQIERRVLEEDTAHCRSDLMPIKEINLGIVNFREAWLGRE